MTVVLCELVDELVGAVREQNHALRAVLARTTAIQAGQNRGAGIRAGAAAPSGPEGDDQGGADVQLREPGLPPEDPDPAPGSERPLAEPSAEPQPATRRPTAKTAAKKAAAKTTPASRQDRPE